MKIDAVACSFAGDKYIGRSYDEMDCQAFVEQCMKDCGLREDLAGSNTWYRHIMNNGWVGTPEECIREFGASPKGALLFILEHDGKEPKQYRQDGIGNASHIGIVIHRHDGAIHSSHSRGGVSYSKFKDKTIPNGGWNRIGLYNKFTYGKSIDWVLEHGGSSGGDEEVIPLQGTVTAPSGSTVNLRKSKDGPLLERIPVGTSVMVVDYGPEWCKVITGGLTGWMRTEFIELEGEVVPGDEEPVVPDPTDDVVQLQVSVEDCVGAYGFLKALCEQIEKKVGRG